MLALSGIVLAIAAWAVEPSVGRAADSAEEAGLKIATEARERQKGFGNFTASLTMILRNKRGQESQRELRPKVIEVEGDGDRTLFVFDRPRDVRGTAFLVHAHKDESDEQWLYLPALKRVKRISSSKQSGSFMGSEFSYADLSAVEIEKYTHRHLRDESCGELECTVLERIPLGKDSGYSRQLVWLDQEDLRTMQVQFFDRRDEHLKTMTVEDYEKYLDRYWRGRQDNDDEPSHGKEHRAALDGLRVRDRPRRGRLHPDRAKTGAVELARSGSSRPPASPTGNRPERAAAGPSRNHISADRPAPIAIPVHPLGLGR